MWKQGAIAHKGPARFVETPRRQFLRADPRASSHRANRGERQGAPIGELSLGRRGSPRAGRPHEVQPANVLRGLLASGAARVRRGVQPAPVRSVGAPSLAQSPLEPKAGRRGETALPMNSIGRRAETARDRERASIRARAS